MPLAFTFADNNDKLIGLIIDQEGTSLFGNYPAEHPKDLNMVTLMTDSKNSKNFCFCLKTKLIPVLIESLKNYSGELEIPCGCKNEAECGNAVLTKTKNFLKIPTQNFSISLTDEEIKVIVRYLKSVQGFEKILTEGSSASSKKNRF
jgi:hypothetical protein